jgi:DNA replication licensing factor MCM6
MEIQPTVNVIEDEEGISTQRLFLDFIKNYRDEKNQAIYWTEVLELLNPDRNTLRIRFDHISEHSAALRAAVEIKFYKILPFLCEAVRSAVVERCEDEALKGRLYRKEFYVGIVDFHTKQRVRDLTGDKVGSLLRISGQVVRTHPVHPELSRGTFVCDDCGQTTKSVVQQFKYTQPTRCHNQQCQNRSRFKLDIHDSQFVDFQRLRIQETQEELPLGCIPRNVEVVVRGEAVETAQPGDHCDFIGTLIVIPDVSALSAPGLRALANSRSRGRNDTEVEGLRGLKALGVRDLNYKLAFLACSVAPSNPAFGGIEFTHEDVSHEGLWNQMSADDQKRLKAMSEDRKICENLANSLFPNIFGNDRIKLGILLMLFGGVAKRTPGSTLRGDINVCLVGDPSCGKSQFLK